MDAAEFKRREGLAAEKREVAHWATPSGKWWATLSVDGLGIFTYDGAGCGGTLGRMSEADALADMERKIAGGYFQPGKTPVKRIR